MRTNTTGHGSTALLEPTRIALTKDHHQDAWRFSEQPGCWYLKIPAGSLLYNRPAPDPKRARPQPDTLKPWSVHFPKRRRAWGLPERIAAAFFAEDRIRQDAELSLARQFVSSPCDTVFVMADLPKLGIQRGNVLAYAAGRYLSQFPTFYGSTRALDLSEYAALRQVCAERGSRSVFTSLSPLSDFNCEAPAVVEFLTQRHRWGKPRASWRSQLVLVQPRES